MSSKRMLALQDDGTVMSLTLTVEGVGQMNDFFKVMKDHMSFEPLVLPHADRGCAFFTQKENRKVYFMYLDPRPRPISYMDESDNTLHQYEIILPPTYVAIFFRGGAIEGGYAVVAPKPIESNEDKLGILPMPNISVPYGRICEGGRATWSVKDNSTKVAASYIEYFLRSNFTSHINQHFDSLPKELSIPAESADAEGRRISAYRRQRMIFDAWQKISKEGGRDAIESMEWKTSFTVSDMIAEIWKGKS